MSKVDGAHVQASVLGIAMIAFGRNVLHLHDLIALEGFEVDVEAPQAMQVLEYFVR